MLKLKINKCEIKKKYEHFLLVLLSLIVFLFGVEYNHVYSQKIIVTNNQNFGNKINLNSHSIFCDSGLFINKQNTLINSFENPLCYKNFEIQKLHLSKIREPKPEGGILIWTSYCLGGSALGFICVAVPTLIVGSKNSQKNNQDGYSGFSYEFGAFMVGTFVGAPIGLVSGMIVYRIQYSPINKLDLFFTLLGATIGVLAGEIVRQPISPNSDQFIFPAMGAIIFGTAGHYLARGIIDKYVVTLEIKPNPNGVSLCLKF